MSGGKGRREVTVRLAVGEVRKPGRGAPSDVQPGGPVRTPKRPTLGEGIPGPAAHIDGPVRDVDSVDPHTTTRRAE